MADAQDPQELELIRGELIDRFGALPDEAENLMAVAGLRTLAKSLGLTEVVLQGKFLRIGPINVPDSMAMKLNRVYPGSLVKSATSTVLVARQSTPNWIAEQEIGDTSVLPWTIEVLNSIVVPVKK
jgi:transcription-repair coupling factor (superfamily II helicase)